MNLRLADLRVWHMLLAVVLGALITLLVIQTVHAHNRATRASHAVWCAENVWGQAAEQRCEQQR